MPLFEIRNRQRAKTLAEALDLPVWLVKAIIVEYLPCRSFQGNTVTIDYGLITIDDLKTLTKPYILLNGLALFHNVTSEVLRQRVLLSMAGFPMANLTKQEALYLPEGKVSPHCLPNFIRNSDEDEGDWKLELHLFKKAVIVDDEELYQWTVTTNTMISTDISQQWYESELFSKDELEELRRINQDYRRVDQDGFSQEEMQQKLEKVYENLETLHIRMRKTVLDYHFSQKNEQDAEIGYTQDAPPQLTLFDSFILEQDVKTNERHFKVRSYVEMIFFHAAQRAAWSAREVRKEIDAGEVYPTNIAEEIEASATCIALSAFCLEAYINGFAQDYLDPLWTKDTERMEAATKWLIVPALLGKPDCFDKGHQPYQDFKKLIDWRNNDLAHYKHKFTPPVPLGTLGTVSNLHAVCNADNSELAIKTVRKMIERLNTSLGFPLPAWVQENISIDSWMKLGIQRTNKGRPTRQEDDPHIQAELHVQVNPNPA